MYRLKPTASLLLITVLLCGCQQQSYTDGSASSSSTARQSFSSNTLEAQSANSAVEAEADAIVILARASLREKPSTSGVIVLKTRKGESLRVLETEPTGPWYKVSHPGSGKEGWVHGNSIKLTTQKSSRPTELSANSSSSSTTARPRREGGTTAGGEDTYINSFGERVPRPRRSASAPAGASARCRDGTYSFSRSRRGTCSHHGGVAEWLY